MTARGPTTVKSASFQSDKLFDEWQAGELAIPQDDDFQKAVATVFSIRPTDGYVYHAVASVTLPQVQEAINHGGDFGLHAWYVGADGKQIDPPTRADIEAYTYIFSSSSSTSKALTAFEKNAKKDSIRARVAQNLLSKRLFPDTVTVSKLKKPHVNPYLDFWAWSCLNLQWAGPDTETVNVKQSHHILPVFYHHFGCVCPSFEALEAIKQFSKDREVFEAGSGNGYWTYLLRRMGLTVHAIDNGDSVWRTMWIGDTQKADAARYIQKHGGAKGGVLVMVYPQVTTPFTTSTIKAFEGDVICVAGTQNANGFTAFKDVNIDDYLRAEKPDFEKLIQTPLPSFAAKDEAFYLFKRRA